MRPTLNAARSSALRAVPLFAACTDQELAEVDMLIDEIEVDAGEVVIREGQRLVVGGVTNDQASNQIRQVPILGRVPVLGWLFRSREISADGEELIVIITPSVITDTTAPPKR